MREVGIQGDRILLNGEPVEIQTQITVNFKLPN